MSNITAEMVRELREITNLGMMECKRALVEVNGDLKKAEELLRVKSGAKAGKVAGRTAAEGVVAVIISADGKNAAIVEVNCETDFVAKDDSFVGFVEAVKTAVLTNPVNSPEDLANVKLANGKTVDEARKEVIAKLGENITVRRFENIATTGVIATYLHGKKIGVMVDLEGGDIDLGKDIAMHIAACKPLCVSHENVPAQVIENERKIYTQQALQSGKPQAIVDKMVEGRVSKYLAEITLLGQPFVKNPDVTVDKLLQDKKAKVKSFVMYVVGEGIEKKVVDFREEVALAAKI